MASVASWPCNRMPKYSSAFYQCTVRCRGPLGYLHRGQAVLLEGVVIILIAYVSDSKKHNTSANSWYLQFLFFL